MKKKVNNPSWDDVIREIERDDGDAQVILGKGPL